MEKDQVYGLSTKDLLKKLVQNGSSLKMLQICEVKDLLPSSKISMRSGILRNGILYQLVTFLLLTKENESGLLPILELWRTPNSWDGKRGPIQNVKPTHQISLTTQMAHKEMWPTPTGEAGNLDVENLITKDGAAPKKNQRVYNKKTGKHVQVTLNRHMQIWPTPQARDWKGPSGGFQKGNDLPSRVQWPTPTATERAGINPKTGRGAGLSHAVRQKNPTCQNLHTAMTQFYPEKSSIEQSSGPMKGRLNPDWTEVLMGLPAGWTRI